MMEKRLWGNMGEAKSVLRESSRDPGALREGGRSLGITFLLQSSRLGRVRPGTASQQRRQEEASS